VGKPGRTAVGAGKGCWMTERGQATSGAGRTGRSRRQTADSPSAETMRMPADATAASAATAGGAANATPEHAATATDAVEQIQAQAGQLVELARDQVTGQITSQKARAADGLGALAATVRQVGQQTRQQDTGPLADYIEGAADQLAQLATTLREQDVAELGETVSGFARRQPALFLAGAVALGFAGVRFLKSSAPAPTGRPGSGFADRAPTGTTFPRGDALGSDRWASASSRPAGSHRGVDAGDAFGGVGWTGSGSARSGFGDLGRDAARGDVGVPRFDADFGAEER